MKTHELKLDIKYFDDVKSGKKNFEIRKNDRDFEVGDILELKAYAGRETAGEQSIDVDYAWTQYLPEEGYDVWENCEEELADTIKVKILNVVPADEYNNFPETVNGIPQSIKWADSYQETYINKINEVLNDYFSTDRLPDGCVILGIEVIK